jgi:WD40 repeat protein
MARPNNDDDDDDDNEEDAYNEVEGPFPISHEVVLKDHDKAVSAFAIDGAGARIATASHDFDVKLWDFGGMDHRMKPFKSFEPAGNYQVGGKSSRWITCDLRLIAHDSVRSMMWLSRQTIKTSWSSVGIVNRNYIREKEKTVWYLTREIRTYMTCGIRSEPFRQSTILPR